MRLQALPKKRKYNMEDERNITLIHAYLDRVNYTNS